MDTTAARGLIALNNRFYAEHAASFDATRRAPWAGWEQLVALLRRQDLGGAAHDFAGTTVRVLDVACGNLRFERFLSTTLPTAPFEFHAVDACAELVAGAANELDGLHFYQVDVLEALLEGGALPLCDMPPADLVVCFGFMHHVPGPALRRSLLEALVGATAPGGMIALSFWQFMDDARLAAKAAAADRAAATTAPPWPGFGPDALDAGDHFLGWQDDSGPLRYCHHFCEAEIDELASCAAAAGARELARYSADGASGTANRYLVLQRQRMANGYDGGV